MCEARVRRLPAKGIAAAALLSLGLVAVGAPSAHAALVISVDCAAGDTIGAALVTARTTFDPVETTALRIELDLQPGWSAGILEWKVE